MDIFNQGSYPTLRHKFRIFAFGIGQTFMKNLKSYIPQYRILLSLGWPIVLGQLGIIVMGLADTLMIGHYGTDELAASAFVNTLFNMILIFCTGFASGLTPVIGALSGRDDFAGAGRMVRNGLAANASIALLTIAVMLSLYPLLDNMGQPDELMPYARPYYILQVASLPFILLFSTYKQFAEGVTDTRTGMWILLSGNVLNIAGNYALIYGRFGLPELGLTGAGISTLASRALMCAAFAITFHATRKYDAYRKGYNESRLTRSGLKQLYRLGFPLGMQTALESSAWSLSAIMIGWLGAVPLAAYQITVTFGNLGYMTYLGMGSAVAIQVSRHSGHNNVKGMQDAITAGTHLLIAQAFFTSVLFFALRNAMPTWFTDDAEVISVVKLLIIPLIIYQFADAIQINYANALRGLADVRMPMVISLATFYCLALPAAYLCGFTFSGGVVGVWMGFPIGLFTIAFLFHLRLRTCLRRIEREQMVI